VRAIRYGVKPDGRAMLLMPVESYNQLDDADIGALIAYLRAAKPVARQQPPMSITLPGRFALMFGLLPGPGAERLNVPRARR
jgi:hypothetical protein